jgi:hypothetical protein
MKRIILSILFLLLMVQGAWGATYTVCTSGCDKTTIQAALTAYTTSGTIIEVRADTPGGSKTYTENLTAAASGITLQNRVGDIITCTMASGNTIFTATSARTTTLKGITFYGGGIDGNNAILNLDSVIVNANGNGSVFTVFLRGISSTLTHTMTNSQIINGGAANINVGNTASLTMDTTTVSGGLSTGISFTSSGTLILSRGNKISGNASTAINITGSGTSYLEYSSVSDNLATGINIAGTAVSYIGNNNINNNGIVTLGDGVDVGASGASAILRNNQILGNSRYGIANVASGVLDYDYNILSGNGAGFTSNASTLAGAVDGGHNQLDVDPKLVHLNENSTYFNLRTDDFYLDYWEALDAALPASVKMTMYVSPSYPSALLPPGGYIMTDAASITRVQTLLSHGHKIAVHGWSHADMTATTMFTVTTVNDNPTVNIDVANHQVILYTTTPGNTIIFPWTGGTTYYGNKTYGDFKAAVSGHNWTITPISGNIHDTMSMASLADSGGARSVGAGYACLLDIVAPNYMFYHEELASNLAWITANFSVTPTVMAYPFNANNATVRAYVKDVLGLNGALSGSDLTIVRLNSVPIYNTTSIDGSYIVGLGAGSEADIRKAARHFYILAKTGNRIVSVLSHVGDVDFSVDQASWFVDEIIDCGGVWSTFEDIVTSIRSDHSSSDGNYTWTKTYTNTTNYNPRPGSPLINNGVVVTGVHDQTGCLDFAGNSCYTQRPDIGAYETQRPGYLLGVGAGFQLSE